MREIQSLARGLQLLDMIINSGRSFGVTELAQHFELDKSTVSRLLKTMETYGYIQQERNSRNYTIGKRLHGIGWQLTNRYSLRETAKPYLHRLAEQTGECAHIGVYSAGKALVTDDVQAETSLLRVVGTSGRLIGLHNTAVGKSLIAFGEFPLPEELPQATPKTITDLGMLEIHLETIRQQGYALDDEENESGVRCIGVPIYDSTGINIATLGISGPTIRITPQNLEQLVNLLAQSACELSYDLGYEGAFPVPIINKT